MNKSYSQLTAMMAILKASLKTAFKSPQAVFFSLFFPVVLLFIFGFLGSGNGEATVNLAWDEHTDSTNQLYQALRNSTFFHFEPGSTEEISDLLKKGRITAKVRIIHTKDTTVPYNIHLITSAASRKNLQPLLIRLENIIQRIDNQLYPHRQTIAKISEETIPGRNYTRVDFLLPGMIGFSLIGAAIFSVAFSFYSLRETLVLKRLYSTPISKTNILLGEAIARVIFQLSTVIVLILFGYFVYDFTLANGIVTFFEMLFLCFIALVVFLGSGFVIAGLAKTQTVIPIYANLFLFPQYFLSGTFFPKEVLPRGLQSIIKFLPLTALNDAMRNVAFEGQSILSCWREIGILAIWGIIVYAIAVKVFKWE